ncbi:MAG: YqeG family HAD IIIA-type phosphatase [Clostridiales bacterium]|nr:YqeG family HAD IIIA-type phosphatase [Clostridiales bacterium]
MFQKFYPSHYVESSYVIPYEKLYEKGYRGIIFDIDNTLVPHGADASKEAIELMDRLRKIGFSICFISNNDEERVTRFNREIQAKYVYKANKPSTKNYLKAIKFMGTTKENTIFVGDQLFTDVYGANRTGITSFLVHPIDKHEEIQIIIKRRLEWIVLKCYARKRKKEKMKTDI